MMDAAIHRAPSFACHARSPDSWPPCQSHGVMAGSGMNLQIVRRHLAALAIGDEFEVHFLAFAQVA